MPYLLYELLVLDIEHAVAGREAMAELLLILQLIKLFIKVIYLVFLLNYLVL